MKDAQVKEETLKQIILSANSLKVSSSVFLLKI